MAQQQQDSVLLTHVSANSHYLSLPVGKTITDHPIVVVRFGEERGPLIGQTSVPGVWIAAGHTCWGVQNGPGTGYLMAELLFDGEARSADVDVLDPKKFKV